jgi:hypothetical protein
MKKTTKQPARAAEPAPQPFGQGLVEDEATVTPRPGPPAGAKRVTRRAIERRLYQLLKPLLEAQGGLVATLEEVGDEGLYGLAITFRNNQSFDLVIRESRK